MSLRRKSCEACFRGRRKCDLTFPTCQRCEKTGKKCRYVGERFSSSIEKPKSIIPSLDATSINSSHHPYTEASQPTTPRVTQASTLSTLEAGTNDINFDFDFATPDWKTGSPNLLDELGDVQPLPGNVESWQWAIDRLRECPGDFAATGGNLFIHPSMYRVQPSSTIKSAFGICTAAQMVTPANKMMFTSLLEDEISNLLVSGDVECLYEGLPRLQAMTLYQILRFCSGDARQRDVAEHHKSATNAWALQLLKQLRAVITQSPMLVNSMLAESVRRTVMVSFLLHALDSLFRHGICAELPTLALLPVSVNSEAWRSGDAAKNLLEEGEPRTMKYGEWTDMWATFSPRPDLDQYQRILMVACKGKSKVEELEAESIDMSSDPYWTTTPTVSTATCLA